MHQTIMITGASGGIGHALALAFAAENTTLILTCRKHPEVLADVAAKVRQRGAICRLFTVDLGSVEEVDRLFRELWEMKLKVNLLINNAGISYTGLLQDMSSTDWHEVINSNLSSVFYCSKGVIPMMLQEGSGKIINISSMWGTYGASCEVAYSASKGGVNAFTKALAKELAPSGIQVNAIACGITDTSMNAHLTEEEKRDFVETIPCGRMATPEEVASLAVQLAQTNSYLTGQIIGFDGGI